MAVDTQDSSRDTANRPAEPPVILDRLLAELVTESPDEELAAPAKMSSLAATESNAVPSRATPPRIGNHFANPPSAALKDHPPKTATPIIPQTTVQPAPLEPPLPSAENTETPAPNKRGFKSGPITLPWIYLLLGAINLLLLVMVIMLFQDRSRLETHLETAPIDTTPPTAPATVPEPVMVPRPTQPEPPEPTIPAPPAADLTIKKLVLCRSVGGFGQYEPIPDIPLTARHIPYIQAYVELTDARPEPRDDGRYIYHLTKHTRLYRTDIGPGEPLMDTSVSQVISGLSPRRDFHTVQALAPTRRVNPGQHTLEITITDQVSGHRATQSTSFMVHPADRR